MPTFDGILHITTKPEIWISYSHHFVMLHSRKRFREQKLQMFCRLCCWHLTSFLSARLLPQIIEIRMVWGWDGLCCHIVLIKFHESWSVDSGVEMEEYIWPACWSVKPTFFYLRRKVAQKYRVMLQSYWKVYRQLSSIHYLHCHCVQSLVEFLNFPPFSDIVEK